MPRRRRKTRSKGISNMSIIYITTISMLNLVGVSYGMWSDSLNINASLSTGIIDPKLNYKRPISLQSLENDNVEYLNVTILEEGKKLWIDGTIYKDNQKTINIDVDDAGTVPFRFERVNEEKPSDIIELIDDKKIQINTNDVVEGSKSFRYDLEFIQDTE